MSKQLEYILKLHRGECQPDHSSASDEENADDDTVSDETLHLVFFVSGPGCRLVVQTECSDRQPSCEKAGEAPPQLSVFCQSHVQCFRLDLFYSACAMAEMVICQTHHGVCFQSHASPCWSIDD
jgi:hypothetical protein